MDNLLNRITADPHGYHFIRETGILASEILDMLAQGDDSNKILQEKSDLEYDDIQATLVYASKKINPGKYKNNQNIKWLIEHSVQSSGVSGKVQKWLEKQKLFSVIRLEDLYEIDSNSEAIRAALYRHVFNTPVSHRNKTKIGFGIKIKTDNTDLMIILPGIRRDWIQLSYDKNYVNNVQNQVSILYGSRVCKFLLASLQKRSVDLASSTMKEATKGNKCRICQILKRSCDRKISACHIIPRRIVFWVAVDSLIKYNINILSEEGISLLEKAIKFNPYHTDIDYIIPLCKDHDRELRNALKSTAQHGNPVDPNTCHFQLC